MTAAHSLSGVAFLVTAVSHVTYPELIGSYIVTGFLIIAVGVTGVFSKIMSIVPNEVIASMLAGLIATYVVKLVGSLHELPVVGGLAVAGYFLCIKWGKRIPAVMGALVFAFIGLWVTGSFSEVNTEGSPFMPAVYMPEFSVGSIFSVAVPLTLLVLSNDIAAGIGALKSYHFRPPIKDMLIWSGLSTVFAGLFGGQSANTAGVMTAISSDEISGKKETRYVASIISGAAILIFGMFAWKVVPFIESLPLAFSAIIAGLALIGPLSSSIRNAFSGGRYRLSTVVAFAIALSNVSFLHISAPVWSLIVGIFIAKTMEQKYEAL